ncbi:DMT family transporter [Acidianus manzaensis]|uniref:EamA family transporter n=1 Tax=Acidianus manzaensis TaxID=282676 RepID=A0A1W6JWM9_9CREN|nr:DMT family transporter [Acidianus manzaensis]ARM74668.1 EamA family transporter [Acidianus manzaensis]
MKEKAILFLGGVAFGTAAIFVKFCTISPPLITFLRFVLAGSILLAFSRKGKFKLKYFIIPSLFLSLHMMFFVSSVFLTTISASTILVSTSPIFAMILRRRIDLFILTAIAGIIIINYSVSFGYLLGNVLALLSAVSFAFYTYFLSKLHYDFTSTASFIYLLSSTFMIPILPVYGIGEFNLVSILAVLGLVLIPTLIGHGSIIYTANKLPISLVTSAELIEPVVATLLAIPIFHQIPNIQEIIGGAITLISIYFIFKK